MIKDIIIKRIERKLNEVISDIFAQLIEIDSCN